MKNILLIIGLLWALGASGQIYIDSYRFGAAPSGGLLLDNYPATAAYSLRKLRTAYTGDCVELRRVSDGSLLNIGWSGDYVDTTAITTFCAGTTCTVQTWYDQSPNGNNAVQATTTAQPTIYASGAILVQGTKKAIKGDGNDNLKAAFTRNQPHAAVAVGTITSSAQLIDGFLQSNSASIANVSSQVRIGGMTISSFQGFFVNSDPANYSLMTALWNGANSQARVNNVSNTGSVGTNGAAGVTIMSAASNVVFNLGFIQEVIIWTTNNTADWANIQADINSFYSIY